MISDLEVLRTLPGQEPPSDIDHINGDRGDNRWSNLRPATRSLNMGNVPKYRNNKSGLKGVTWRGDKGMWRANITINYRSIHLGYFLTKEQAYAAYLAASQETFGEYAHHKSRS